MRIRATGRLPVACRCIFTALVVTMWGSSARGGADGITPYYVGGGLAFGYDSNLFRQSAPLAQADRYLAFDVAAGFDQPIQRQRVRADLTLRSTRYETRSDLDNLGGGLFLQWDGATAGGWAGSATLRANQSLATYVAGGDITVQSRNIERVGSLQAQVIYGLTSIWSLNGSAELRGLTYSAPELASQENTQQALAITAQWRPGTALQVALGPRFTHARYPQAIADGSGGFFADSFDRRDLDLTTTWTASGATSVTARLSASEETHDVLSRLDIAGTTGAINAVWQPTGKLTFNLAASRDTGSETSFANLGSAQQPLVGVGDSSQLTARLFLSTSYQATAKIQAGITVLGEQRRLETHRSIGPFTLPGEFGHDRTLTAAASLHYEPNRTTTLECRFARIHRSVESGTVTPFDVRQGQCQAQITLR